MTHHERYWDRMAGRYAAMRIRDAGAYEHTLARTTAWLSPDDNVVEFGCGTGTSALRLAPSARHIDATDFSAAMIEIANKKAQAEQAGNLTFRRADLFDAAAVPGPYDAALAFNFLQLMADLPAALAAVARRLKPGGLFISKSVCLGERGWRTARVIVRGLRSTGVLPPIQFLAIVALERAIEDAGFEILERDLFSQRPPSLFLVARKAG
jgi:ubiquinone/menaquinone biosynthesis C-methylase UbiE